MRAIMESLFCVAYLITVLVLGIRLVTAGKDKHAKLYGLMSLVLVGGDAFHLVPRIIGLNSPAGLEGYTAALGIGTLVTSITMTIFYVMLYHFWQRHFQKKDVPAMSWIVWALAAIRIALCLFPQNAWTSSDSPVSWGIYRNIPFVILGALVVYLFYLVREADKCFKWAWLAITLSFLFYIPVVLWADVSPMVGMLMLPKTCCYVWLVAMGYRRLM